ncbi:prepilin-type N-terminal cleavage/methylation domain-containing protein [Lignipirellula cremea]|uniref:Type II secretion system protein G n=1 Tax=Lignipirellula cremea TaxID=2528010 RepID=A0A518DMG9_9BACT|nr:prepilin-type N-terminal cleavage/methylation domain-containing protein [Lignipirellula cremea]QDU93036.1 hypothetical protein Pla8534_08110 [Lignipirellula cremea]
MILRRGFTLVEMLIVVSILTLVAGMLLFAMQGVTEQARTRSTETEIQRISDVLLERWDSYKTRPVRVAAGAGLMQRRLNALRELQRAELPERKSDVTTGTVAMSPVQRGYQRKVLRLVQKVNPSHTISNWTTQHESAECLWLILGSLTVGDTNALSLLTEKEVGDTDGDGVPEVLDAWGVPLMFLRWAPGFSQSTLQGPGATTPAIDVFDPLQADPRYFDGSGVRKQADVPVLFALTPLIASAGPDKEFGLAFDIFGSSAPLNYAQTTPPNDPYFDPRPTLPQAGTADVSVNTWADNITNHLVE